MSSPLVTGSDMMDEFVALGSMESQAIYLIAQLTAKENAFNTANPNNLSNRATTAVNFDQRTVTGQITLALNDEAVRGRIVDSVIPFLP